MSQPLPVTPPLQAHDPPEPGRLEMSGRHDDLLTRQTLHQSPARLAGYGFVRVEPVRRAWLEHLDGRRNWDHCIWTVLMLQAWRERWS